MGLKVIEIRNNLHRHLAVLFLEDSLYFIHLDLVELLSLNCFQLLRSRRGPLRQVFELNAPKWQIELVFYKILPEARLVLQQSQL